MSEILRNLIYCTSLYGLFRPIKQSIELLVWYWRGRPIPLPALRKQRTVIEYSKRFPVKILVETGTYRGDMLYATRNVFQKIISIELDKNLYEGARRRLSKFCHINIKWGDSKDVLTNVLVDIQQPCLFWIDAHYSGGVTARGELDTPIMQELQLILAHQTAGHVVLIDDARCFVGQNSYPTIKSICDLLSRQRPGWVVEVKDDIIRLHS